MNIPDLQSKLQSFLGYLKQDSTNLNLLLSISDCYRQLNDLASAQHFLDQAKSVSGQPFWTKQGSLFLAGDQLSAAKNAFKQALTEQENSAHQYNYAWCLFLNEEFEAALAVLSASEKTQQLREFVLLKAKTLQRLQRQEEAIELLEIFIQQSEADGEVFGLLGLLHFDNHSVDQADFYSANALVFDPLSSLGQLVQLLLRALKNEATVAEIESMLVNNPKECRLWFTLGTMQMQQLNITAAEKAFNQAVQLWPNFYECWVSIGWCYLLQNNLDRAENAYQQVVVIDDEGADGWGGLALVSALRDQLDIAKTWLQKSVVLDASCFLAAMTRVIIANQENPEQSGALLYKALPGMASEMNTLLLDAMKMTENEGRVIH